MYARCVAYRLVVLAILAAGCGRQPTGTAAAGPTPASRPTIVRVDLGEAGRTVTLRRGDSLIVSLPRTLPPRPMAGTGYAGGGWVLLSYPRAVLTLSAQEVGAGFAFTARAAGRGQVVAARNWCAGAARLRAAIACPISAADGGPLQTPPGPSTVTADVAAPGSRFVLTVNVTR